MNEEMTTLVNGDPAGPARSWRQRCRAKAAYVEPPVLKQGTEKIGVYDYPRCPVCHAVNQENMPRMITRNRDGSYQCRCQSQRKKKDLRTERLKNDYIELQQRFDPERVQIRRVDPSFDTMMELEICVHAPSAYISGGNDSVPVDTDEMTFRISIKYGYPEVEPEVSYEMDRRLANAFVYSWGNQRIQWDEDMSLADLTEQVVRTIIYDPSLCRTKRMSDGYYPNPQIIPWQEKRAEEGKQETIMPCLLFNRIGKCCGAEMDPEVFQGIRYGAEGFTDILSGSEDEIRAAMEAFCRTMEEVDVCEGCEQAEHAADEYYTIYVKNGNTTKRCPVTVNKAHSLQQIRDLCIDPLELKTEKISYRFINESCKSTEKCQMSLGEFGVRQGGVLTLMAEGAYL